jgi:hypothetical protein
MAKKIYITDLLSQSNKNYKYNEAHMKVEKAENRRKGPALNHKAGKARVTVKTVKVGGKAKVAADAGTKAAPKGRARRIATIVKGAGASAKKVWVKVPPAAAKAIKNPKNKKLFLVGAAGGAVAGGYAYTKKKKK